MSRRIEIELTSDRGDGTWTWRAAGAQKPRGVLDGSLLGGGAKVGDVLRAELEVELEGMTVTSVGPTQTRARTEPERIEILGSGRRDEEQLVTTQLARPLRTDRDRRDRDRGPRGDRPEGDRRDRDRRDRDRGPRTGGPEGERGGARSDRPGGDRRPGADRPAGDRGPTGERGQRGERGDRGGPRSDRPSGERRERPAADRRPRRPAPPPLPERPKAKRLRPGRTHRKAVLDGLPAEHQPIAEEVLRGGIPAVRQAIDAENAKRSAAGEPPIGPELLRIAEQLLPRLRTADWRDRAEAALADADQLDLRDLRSVVVASDNAARDDETRELAAGLRAKLDERVVSEQAQWVEDLRLAIEAGRIVRALRISSRPPKAGTMLAPDVRAALTEGASAALTEDATPERWAAVLDAIAYAPVRNDVAPASIPATPSAELLATVKKSGSRVPKVAAAFGIEVTAPSRPAGRALRPPKPPRRPGTVPVPPRPESPSALAAPTPTEPTPSVDAPAAVVAEQPAEPDRAEQVEQVEQVAPAANEPSEDVEAPMAVDPAEVVAEQPAEPDRPVEPEATEPYEAQPAPEVVEAAVAEAIEPTAAEAIEPTEEPTPATE